MIASNWERISPAMSAEQKKVERSANTAAAAETIRELVVATGLVRASLRSASFALIAGGTPALPGNDGATGCPAMEVGQFNVR